MSAASFMDEDPMSPGDFAAQTTEVREFPVLADEAFIGLPGEIARVIEPTTESDPAGILLSLHAYFGNCIGRGPHYLVESSKHGPNIFILKVGDSAKARKGTGEDRVRAIFDEIDEDWTHGRIHTGLSSGEGVIWEVRNELKGMRPDKKTGELVEVIIDAGVSDKRLLVVESEFAGALRVMARDGNILSRVLRDAWDTGNLATLTKNSPAKATGACVSIVGHITSTELRQCLDETSMANGFGNRFLFACVRRSKLLPFGSYLSYPTIADMASKVRRAVDKAQLIKRVSMSDAAAEAWCAIYEELSGDKPGLLGSLTARAEAQVVRLATIYALWAGSDRIELCHLMAATAVQEFCARSVEYIFGDTLGDKVADTIMAALKGAVPDGLTRTQINALFQRHVDANQIARALDELYRRGIAAKQAEATGGRPVEVWKIVEGGRP